MIIHRIYVPLTQFKENTNTLLCFYIIIYDHTEHESRGACRSAVRLRVSERIRDERYLGGNSSEGRWHVPAQQSVRQSAHAKLLRQPWHSRPPCGDPPGRGIGKGFVLEWRSCEPVHSPCSRFDSSLSRSAGPRRGTRHCEPKSQTLNPKRNPTLNPKHRARQGLAVGLGVKSAVAEEQVKQVESKPKFRRLPRIQFIAALGEPSGVSRAHGRRFCVEG